MDAPLKRFGAPTEIVAELASQVALLEAMFSDPGLADLRRRHIGHPAVRRYDNLLAGREIPYNEDSERTRLQDLSQGLLDRMTWAQNPGVRPFWTNTVLDADQALQVEHRIYDPKQYDDTTLELFVWGALRSDGVAAQLQERDGEPDIHIPGAPEEGWLEIKRIHLGSVPSRARQVLKKANSQIRRVSPTGAGAAYLFIETTADAAAFDDAIPADVGRYVDEIRRTLGSSVNKHLAQVVIGWDDFMVIGHLPDPVMYAVRRRALVLNRANPLAPPPAIDWVRALGFTSVTWIRPAGSSAGRPAALVTDNLVISALFQDRNDWVGGIRASHARRVLESPDGVVEVPLTSEGMSVVLATKRIDMTEPPHVMLLIGFRRQDEPLTLSDGFRLKGSGAELEAWRVDPSIALDELLRRYGLPVSVGSGPAQLFHLHCEGSRPPTLSFPGTDDSQFAIAFFAKSSLGLWEVDWVYAIDDAAYRASYEA